MRLIAFAAPFILLGVVTHVRDGDTIEVDDIPVRLKGIAAPERNEIRGRESTLAMLALLGQQVVCRLTGETSRDRLVGWCNLVATDLGEMQLRAGLARRCPAYDLDGRYSDQGDDSDLPLPAYCIAAKL